jgi:predicted XRE-type DNA-binding protein
VYENWLPVPEYEGLYKVSDRGQILNIKRLCVLSHATTRSGTDQVTLCKNKKRKNHTVSRLVAAAFIGPCPEGMCVLHGPMGRNYHGVDNLRYGTHQKNMLNRKKDGNYSKGEKSHMAKLNNMQVRVIRRLLESKSMKQKEIAEIFGVRQSAISCIKRGLTWQM